MVNSQKKKNGPFFKIRSEKWSLQKKNGHVQREKMKNGPFTK